MRQDRPRGRPLRMARERGTLLHRDRLCAVLDSGHSFSVVRAPMGFGKSVLVSEWLSDLRTDSEHVLQVSAGRPNHRSAPLWHAISAGVQPWVTEETVGGRSSRWGDSRDPHDTSPSVLLDRLNALTEPLTLVIDDFEQVRDPEITHQLVNMANGCEFLHLVLVGRVIIGIDDLTERMSPNTIVSEADLTLTPSETAAMLSAANPSLSDADFAAAHQRLRGWPLATAALAGILANDLSQISVAEATIEARTKACRDLAVAAGVDQQWVGIVSMAAELNLEITTLLLEGRDGRAKDRIDDHDAAVVLDRLERNGLLSPPDPAFGGGRRTAHWSPTLRRVIRDDFVRRHPTRASAIDAVLARWYAAHEAPGPAITHAARGAQWDLLLSLLETHSTSVLDGDWQEFSRAITTAPREVIANSSSGAAWRAIAFHLPIDPHSGPNPRRFTLDEATEIGRSPRAREAVQDQFWQHILYRRRGLFEQAGVASENAQRIIQEAIIAGTPGVVGLQSLVLTHSGSLHAILGELRTAIGDFIEAHRQAPLSELSFSAADAAGKAALSYAMMGDLPNATLWLRRDAVAPVSQGSVTPYVRSAGLIARALVASVALRADQCAANVDAFSGIVRMDELWPFAAYARQRQALLWGDCDNALDELQDIESSPDMLAATLAPGGVVTWLVPSAKAELLMALGRGNQARAVLNETDSDHSLVNLARARLALLSGDNETAIALTTAAGDVPAGRAALQPSGTNPQASSPLQRLECLVIRGVANNRLGATEVAADLLRRAVNQAERLGALLPFVRVPREELIAIAESEHSLAELLDVRLLEKTPDVYPPHVDVLTLNEREQSILDGFAGGLSFRQIAAVNFVSTNTIKSQTQALYRKLHVSSRHEALATAGALQLHNVNGHPPTNDRMTVVQRPDPAEETDPGSDLDLEDGTVARGNR